jgi:hypothetical protein
MVTPAYQPRDPSNTVLYQVIADHLETFLASFGVKYLFYLTIRLYCWVSVCTKGRTSRMRGSTFSRFRDQREEAVSGFIHSPGGHIPSHALSAVLLQCADRQYHALLSSWTVPCIFPHRAVITSSLTYFSAYFPL